MMSRSTLFGLVVFIICELSLLQNAVAQPSPPFKVFIQEEFFNTKLRIHHLGPFDTLEIRIGGDSHKIPTQTPFYFRPLSDNFTIAIEGITQAGTAYAGLITIQRNPDSLVIMTPEGSPFIPAKQVLLRIPRYLKNHLYWFDPYARKGQSVLEVQPRYERALNAIGAARVELLPGDYGWFTLRRDSVLRIDSCRSGRGPVMFFSYFGPEEVFSWTVRKTARDIAQPPNLNIWVDVYAEARERDTLPHPSYENDPNPDFEALYMPIAEPPRIGVDPESARRGPQQEIDTVLSPKTIPRIFFGDLWEARNHGIILIYLYTEGIMPCNASGIRFRVAETDERVYIHIAPTFPRGLFSDAAQPCFKRIGGQCQFLTPSDTFDLSIVNLNDTATFHVMLDSTTIRLTRQEVQLVILRNSLLWRDPLDLFWVYVPFDKVLPPSLRDQWKMQVTENCAKIGATHILMPTGYYASRGGIKQIRRDSINTLVDKRDSSQILFFHYIGSRKSIEKAVNTIRKYPTLGYQYDFPIYFGPRSISALLRP